MLDLTTFNLKRRETRRARARTIVERVVNVQGLSKSTTMAGLQLADLVISPIGQFLLGQPI